MNFYKKTVAIVTLFFAGTSGLFLAAGTGLPGLRLLVGVVFFISVLNLSIYWREFGRWLSNALRRAKGHLAEARKAKNITDDEDEAEMLPPKTRELKKAKVENKPRIKNHYGDKRNRANDFEEDDDDFDLDNDDDDFEFEDEDEDGR